MNNPAAKPSLTLSWSWLLGSAAFDAARAVAISPGGTILVSGTTAGDLDGQSTFGSTDAFLARFTRDGKKLSVTQWGSSDSESANGIAVAADGTSFVTGISGGTLGGQSNAGGVDAFLTRFEPSGTRSWTKMWGSFDGDYAQAIALGSAGSILVAGYTQGNLEGISNRGDDAFVTRFDANGTRLWTRLVGTAAGDYASAIAVDTWSQQAQGEETAPNDRIYLVGASFGAWQDSPYKGGSSDAFLVSLSAGGNTLWSRQIGTPGDDWARAVAVGANGEVYVAGEAGGALAGEPFAGGESDVFLRKYLADGSVEWTRMLGSAATDTVNGLTVASDGAVYLSGATYGSVDGETNPAGDDLFLARYASNGTRDWVWQLGTTANESTLAIATHAGSLILAGFSEGNFEGQGNRGLSDAFVASLMVSDPPTIERTGRTKYFVVENSSGNLFDFNLNHPDITLRNENIELVGSSAVDHARMRPGTVLDFTFSGASADKVYLPGPFSDYATILAGTVITLTRGSGDTYERLTVNTSQSAMASDLLVFADGLVNSANLADYLRNPNGLVPPVPNGVETFASPAPPATTGHPLGALAKGFALKEAGSTFAPMTPGVRLFAVGSVGVDKLYVADGTVVDATSLGASTDEIYFRGAWADYAKQVASGANTFSLSRSSGGLSELVTVAAGAGALDDLLIFTDGSVSSRQALLALQGGNLQIPLKSISSYDPTKSTPGVAVFMVDSLLDNRSDLDPRSDLVLTFSTSITAQPGKTVRIVNDGGSGPNGLGFRGEATDNSYTIALSDASQVSIVGNRLIINPARDLDLSNRYHIEFDEGAFKGANGLPSEAFNGTQLLNFETVRPGAASTNPADPRAASAPSVRMSEQGQLVASQRWIDIEALGSSSGSAGIPVNLGMGSFALAFKDYSNSAPSATLGFDGVQVRGFWAAASDFGADDLVYIDDQHKQPNDLAQSYILTAGNAPTRIQFAADNSAPSGSALAGWIDVTLVGSTAGFGSVAAWGQQLGLSGGTLPIVSG